MYIYTESNKEQKRQKDRTKGRERRERQTEGVRKGNVVMVIIDTNRYPMTHTDMRLHYHYSLLER